MDKISVDLLDQIRTAVIEKLREMDRYVDNELPDYIMILVANKRTIAHMQKDLHLFLGKHTAEFTVWLFDMVAELKNSSSTVAAPLKSEKNKEVIDEDADVLDYDLGDQEGDLLYQDENSTSSKPGEDNQKTEASLPTKEIAKKKETVVPQLSAQKSAKVYPVQPVSRLPVNPNVPAFLDEYDPTKPEFTSGVSSVVRSMKRGHSKPPVTQTNKLLLRAVKDATKSIIDNKNMNRYKPTPIKVLASTKIENSGSRPHNLVNIPINPSLNFDTSPVLNASEASNPDAYGQEPPMSVYETDNYYGHLDNKSINRALQLPSDQLQTDSDLLPYLKEYSTTDDPSHQLQEYSEVDMEQDEEEPAKTHFIVTLDGVDVPSLKRKFLDSDESMDAEDSFNEDYDSQQKRQKGIERCMYWPSCKNSDDCFYYHPSVPCKTFPGCRYGDKCLYIHPNCKFDARCSRKDCPYTHAAKKSFSFPLVTNKRPVVARGIKAVCKFYPKCTMKNCAFIHPKLCRFGTKCRLPTCSFTHVSVPPRNQLKWKANVSEDI